MSVIRPHIHSKTTTKSRIAASLICQEAAAHVCVSGGGGGDVNGN